MATPASSRGIPYSFDADKFRNAIRFVFEMGAPAETGLEVTCHFTELVSSTGYVDGDQVPFDPTQSVVRTTKSPVTVPANVEFSPASDAPTAFGQIIPAKLKVLLLDEDYTQVSDATFVVVNGDKYNRLYEEPSIGLFDVGLHTIVFQAENEL